MTVSLDLKPELVARLRVQAQAIGMAVEEYLVSIVERTLTPVSDETMSTEDRAAAFESWSASHRPTSPLSDYSVSRDGIYEGRDH